MKNIILTGLRGSGKTAIGKILAKELGYNFVDLDEEIEKTTEMKINEMVEKHGWVYFREREVEAAAEAASLQNTVIATGGGTITFPKNNEALKKSGTIIYLKRDPEICIKYIKNDPNRPSLTNEQNKLKDLQKTYKDRKEIYKKTANNIFERSENREEDCKKIIDSILST